MRQCRVEGGTSAVVDGDEPLKTPSQWKPLLLLVPLRLGLSDINPVYINGLKVIKAMFNHLSYIYEEFFIELDGLDCTR